MTNISIIEEHINKLKETLTEEFANVRYTFDDFLKESSEIRDSASDGNQFSFDNKQSDKFYVCVD